MHQWNVFFNNKMIDGKNDRRCVKFILKIKFRINKSDSRKELIKFTTITTILVPRN